ncbi:MAG: peptidoglycan recognition protein family protein [Anaerolineae bacterium]|nr:peptidoglycan recognition protein family protein [Anaerolineae bacterium]
MKRRTFILWATVAAAGGLLLDRAGDYWLIQKQLAYSPLLPTLPVMPTPVPRSDWDARPVNHEAASEFGFDTPDNPSGWLDYPQDLTGVYHTVAIHHSALSREEHETMRSIQDGHMDGRGWADIGYHFGIDADGLLYAGRDITARGASVEGGNTGVIGVVVMGNFEIETPTNPQLTALQTLVNWLAQTYHLTTLAGHSELNNQTVCPGHYLKVYLDLLAKGAGLQRPV